MVRLKELSDKYGPSESNTIDGLSELFEFIRDEISSGGTLELYPEEIEIEEGNRSKVQVLRIGRVASLYLSRKDERTGILLKREGIYQWEEGVDEPTKRKIRGVFKNALAGNPGVLGIPLDITLGRRSIAEVESTHGATSFLMKGGPIMIPLILVGLAALIMIVERVLFLRKNRIEASGLMDKLSGLLKEKRYLEAKRLLE